LQYLAFLQHSSVSLTHCFANMEKYMLFLKALDGSFLVQWTFEAWQHQPLVFYRIILRFLKEDMVTMDQLLDFLVGAIDEVVEANFVHVGVVWQILMDQVDSGEQSFSWRLVDKLSSKSKLSGFVTSIMLNVFTDHVVSAFVL
jgi:hypothetical protein